MGALYEHGVGVPQDDTLAAEWYRKAAERGHAGAEFNMGRLYSTGRGVAHDDAEAWYWFNAAAQQTGGAQRDRAEQARNEVEKRLTSAELARLRERSKQLLAARAQAGP